MEEGQEVFAVSELVELLRDRLRELGSVWVEGEIGSVFRSRAGHAWFDLKDAEAQLRAVLFEQQSLESVEPEEGRLVRARVRVDVYPERGSLQLVVQQLQPLGEGELRIAFERLKARLNEEGLFDAANKRPLPYLPRRIGLVTSRQGAAVHDFLRALRRRFPGAEVLLYAARVQGEGAWREVVRGLHLLASREGVDVIVMTRGGGSIEDLWTFNREELVRAIAELDTPVVSAIGHEVDLVLTDLVADARASTPTAAVELIVPDVAQKRHELQSLAHRVSSAQHARLERMARSLDGLRRAVVHPARRLAELGARTDALSQRLRAAVALRCERGVASLGTLSARLEALSPLSVLGRGYAIARRAADGALLRAATDVEPDDEIHVRLASDGLRARVLARTEEG